MSIKGALGNESGSGYSTPQSLESDESYFVLTLEMAALQIQGILQFCIDKNKNNLNIGALLLRCEKQNFDKKVSSLFEFNGDELLALCTLKEYVLKVSLPRILQINENDLLGRNQLYEKLFEAAINWPIPNSHYLENRSNDKPKQSNYHLHSNSELEDANSHSLPSLLMIYSDGLKIQKAIFDEKELVKENVTKHKIY